MYTNHIPPPCDEPVGVIFADEHLLVVNKPAGLLSVPGRFVKDCVLHRMLFEYPDARIVHRLDLDSSGLLVLALSQLATSDLNRQFREQTIGKAYDAIVDGVSAETSGTIELPLRPDPVNRPKQLVDHEQGKPALTRYEVMERHEDSMRLKLVPVTGRSHQLRIHCSAIGHPILGCDLYGDESTADRLLLHAAALTLDHPATGQRLSFESAVPF